MYCAIHEIYASTYIISNLKGNCGNRKRSAQHLCTACCGDNLCNRGSCFEILSKFYSTLHSEYMRAISEVM